MCHDDNCGITLTMSYHLSRMRACSTGLPHQGQPRGPAGRNAAAAMLRFSTGRRCAFCRFLCRPCTCRFLFRPRAQCKASSEEGVILPSPVFGLGIFVASSDVLLRAPLWNTPSAISEQGSTAVGGRCPGFILSRRAVHGLVHSLPVAQFHEGAPCVRVHSTIDLKLSCPLSITLYSAPLYGIDWLSCTRWRAHGRM